jgi:pSer/pThr/pTyr-binding forkhead associated (FHA) protein
MKEFVLNISSPEGSKQIPLTNTRLTIGRSDIASIIINDDGLSRLHASIHRDGDRIWILDEGSTNGTYVNGNAVSPAGTPLSAGDRIQIGNHTSIVIDRHVVDQPSMIGAVSTQSTPTANNKSLQLSVIASLSVVIIFIISLVAFGVYKIKNRSKSKKVADITSIENLNEPLTDGSISTNIDSGLANNENSPLTSNEPTPTLPPEIITTFTPDPTTSNASVPVGTTKLYLKMTPQEQLEFVEKRAQHVSMMMGNRSYQFTPEVVEIIKRYVDGYARRVGNNSTKLWGEDMRFMFARARTQYVPHIIRAFNAKGVPPVVGLYLCVIETEYHNIESENFAGAAGLFQFIGPTAEAYGVPRAERTNVEKMAPAAAAYIADRIAEFGTDSMSVALGIAGYNRNPDSVRRDLHDVLNSENKERSFWTLVSNSSKLDRWFQGENIKYVPKFFAAAIVGENPWNFGLDMRPLSTYTEIETNNK